MRATTQISWPLAVGAPQDEVQRAITSFPHSCTRVKSNDMFRLVDAAWATPSNTAVQAAAYSADAWGSSFYRTTQDISYPRKQAEPCNALTPPRTPYGTLRRQRDRAKPRAVIACTPPAMPRSLPPLLSSRMGSRRSQSTTPWQPPRDMDALCHELQSRLRSSKEAFQGQLEQLDLTKSGKVGWKQFHELLKSHLHARLTMQQLTRLLQLFGDEGNNIDYRKFLSCVQHAAESWEEGMPASIAPVGGCPYVPNPWRHHQRMRTQLF